MKSELHKSSCSLATRLLRVTLGFYLVVVICSMIGQMFVEYQYHKNSIRREFTDIQTTFEKVLAGAIWNLDEKALQATVKGIVDLPPIVGIKIYDDQGALIAIGGIVQNGDFAGETGLHVHLQGIAPDYEKVHGGETYRLEMFKGEFPIIHSDNHEQKILGRVTLYSNTSVILGRVKMSFLLMGVMTSAEIGILWIIFYLVFVRLLKKPLSELTNAIQSVTLANLDSIKAAVRAGGRDELGVLAESFNQMLSNLRSEIAKRKIADESLIASEARLNSIMKVAPAGIGLIKKGRLFDAVNPAMFELTGYSSEELRGQSTRLLYATEEEYLRGSERLLDLIKQHGIGTVEALWSRKDGKRVDVILSAAALAPGDSDGYITFVALDITERKLAEEREKQLSAKLERAGRMESLGVLAGGVAHDLNNVLGPIVVLPDMVADYIGRCGNPCDPEHADALEAMQTLTASALRATAMVSDLVMMGRRGQFQKMPVDVNKAVSQLLGSKQIKDLQVCRPNVSVYKRLSLEPVWCLGSESRLVRVFANLVGNAVEAIDGSGDVTVRTGRKVLTELYHGYEDVPAGDYVIVQVEDNGTGIDAQTVARIFEPFFSTKAPSKRSGSGLGLSVVNGLVKDHGGFLDVKSLPGRGTTFTVYLPSTSECEGEQLSRIEELPGGHERILVVDDEPGQQVVLRQQLSKLGYAVGVVGSGEEAAELFETARRQSKAIDGAQGGSSPFDLVLMDMIMKGMDGLATSKAILKLFPKQKILIVSGHAPDDMVEEVEALGLNWLPKPYRSAELARVMRAELDIGIKNEEKRFR